MTKEILQYLSLAITQNLPIDEVRFVGRKSKDGFTVEGGEYIGITDDRGRYGYFRFTGDNDHEYEKSTGPTSRGDWYDVKTDLRLVVVSDREGCGSVAELEASLAKLINSTKFPPATYGRVHTLIKSSTSDIEEIFAEETDKEEMRWPDHLYLVAVDFELTYLSNECCDVEIPISGDCPAATYTVYVGEEVFETGSVEAGGEVVVNVPEASNARYELKDSGGNLISEGQIEPGGIAVITAPDGAVSYNNSAGTLPGVQLVKSGGNENIIFPDTPVSIVDQFGAPLGSQSVPSGVPAEIPVTVPESIPTIGWQGKVFTYTQTALDNGIDGSTDYYTLSATNFFGNTLRLTGKTGGGYNGTDFVDVDGNTTTKGLAYPDNMVLIHDIRGRYNETNKKVLCLHILEQAGATIDNHLSLAAAYVHGGIGPNRWFLPTNAWFSILARQTGTSQYAFNHPPFNPEFNTNGIWMCVERTGPLEQSVNFRPRYNITIARNVGNSDNAVYFCWFDLEND